jgi:hypothetical protein
MKHSNRANHLSSSDASHDGAPSIGTACGVYGDRDTKRARAIAIEATRELRGPLGALRVLLEGSRGGTTAIDFADRALAEVGRAEGAANDLVAWTLPRTLRSTSTDLSKIAASLLESLTPSHRRRTHVVVEHETTAIQTDAPLLVECFARSLRHAFQADGTAGLEVMVHIHATDDLATFSFIHTGSTKHSLLDGDGEAVPHLADEILDATATRLGGKSSIHDAEGHRCSVVTLPLSSGSRTGAIQ